MAAEKFSFSVSPGHKFPAMFERVEDSHTFVGGQEVFRRCCGGSEIGRLLRCVVTSAQGPPNFSLIRAAPGSSSLSPGAQRPEVRSPAEECGCTVPGPDSEQHASQHLPCPLEIAPQPSGPAAPAAPRPRAPPSLPCAALLCWAARAWTSRTSRQSPGRRPEPIAGATRGRAAGAGLAAPGGRKRAGPPSAGGGRGGSAPPGPGWGLRALGADRGALGGRLPMLPASPGRTPGRAEQRARRGGGRPALLTEGNPRPLQARLC